MAHVSLFLKRLLFNILFYTIANLLFIFMRTYGIGETEMFEQVQPVDHQFSFIIIILIGIIAGSTTTISDYVLSHHYLRKFSYGRLILIASIFHIIMLFMVMSVIYHVFVFLKLEMMTADTSFWEVLKAGPAHVFMLYMTIVSFTLMFMKQLDFKLGPGNLRKIIFGYYHQPRQEVRIFMFLDLKSSTTAAEQMGHISYSEMLQDCFTDLTGPVTEFKAEIYQYVGDEVILHWNQIEGADKNNCVHTFFRFNEILQQKSAYYQKKYNWTPEFKAGVHMGSVTVAEVGYVKRDIAYHGDVLNTAARIQGICNIHNRNILISEDLYKLMVGKTKEIVLTEVATEKLKGKSREVVIYGVSKTA